jgi:hypothetical protein
MRERLLQTFTESLRSIRVSQKLPLDPNVNEDTSAHAQARLRLRAGETERGLGDLHRVTLWVWLYCQKFLHYGIERQSTTLRSLHRLRS